MGEWVSCIKNVQKSRSSLRVLRGLYIGWAPYQRNEPKAWERRILEAGVRSGDPPQVRSASGLYAEMVVRTCPEDPIRNIGKVNDWTRIKDKAGLHSRDWAEAAEGRAVQQAV